MSKLSTAHPRQARHLARNVARLVVASVAAAGLSLALSHADATAAGGRTFYLSPSGSDSNSGTDPDHPFKSLEKVSNGFLQPGDTVLLQRGATFSGKLGLWASGTASQRITVASYGDRSAPKPVITGDCVWVGASYITLQDFHVTNCNTDGIWSDGTDNVITGVEASHNIQGIEIGEHARNNKVLRNYLHHNDKMWPNTPGAFDDSGAVGMVVVGDNTEVAYNRSPTTSRPRPTSAPTAPRSRSTAASARWSTTTWPATTGPSPSWATPGRPTPPTPTTR